MTKPTATDTTQPKTKPVHYPDWVSGPPKGRADPFDLHIVGWDDSEGESNPLYDHRLNYFGLDYGLVDSIIHSGVLQPVTVRADGGKLVVIDGRRRVGHARAACLRILQANHKATREALVSVPYVIRQGDVAISHDEMLTLNAYRQETPAIVLAREAAKQAAEGKTVEQIARTLGKTGQCVRDWLGLMSSAPEVIDAVAAEQISLNAAKVLGTVPMSAQVDALRAMVVKPGKRAGAKEAKEAVEKVRGKGDGSAEPTVTPKGKLLGVQAIMDRVVARCAKDDTKTPDLEWLWEQVRQLYGAVYGVSFAKLVAAAKEEVLRGD